MSVSTRMHGYKMVCMGGCVVRCRGTSKRSILGALAGALGSSSTNYQHVCSIVIQYMGDCRALIDLGRVQRRIGDTDRMFPYALDGKYTPIINCPECGAVANPDRMWCGPVPRHHISTTLYGVTIGANDTIRQFGEFGEFGDVRREQCDDCGAIGLVTPVEACATEHMFNIMGGTSICCIKYVCIHGCDIKCRNCRVSVTFGIYGLGQDGMKPTPICGQCGVEVEFNQVWYGPRPKEKCNRECKGDCFRHHPDQVTLRPPERRGKLYDSISDVVDEFGIV